MEFDTIILGAGAAGLYAAPRCGGRVLVVDHAKAPGEKIRISGGGRCNFTNIHTAPECFLSDNPHFAKSALARRTPWDFVAEVEAAGIAWHEKTLGQLFCDGSARQIVTMLTDAARAAGAELWLSTELGDIRHDGRFSVELTREGRSLIEHARNLIVATGGKSIPKMGATGRAYEIARQFGHGLVEPRPGLVPFTFDAERFAGLSGLSLPVRASAGTGPAFEEALLFTHRGLSGPALLQISSYWREGESFGVDLLPGTDAAGMLVEAKARRGGRQLRSVLAEHLPDRLATTLAAAHATKPLAEWRDEELRAVGSGLAAWQLRPSGTEGYRTAEVTVGGVDTDGLSSRTMASKTVPGLYFIGECVDVTGWLGGYNFQWAWASAAAAAEAIRSG